LWKSVLLDTAISYSLSKPFFRDVDRGMTVLGNPFVWRPLIEGTVRGATLAETVLKSAGYLVRSWTNRTGSGLVFPHPGPVEIQVQ
jgi:hypothetical protein